MSLDVIWEAIRQLEAARRETGVTFKAYRDYGELRNSTKRQNAIRRMYNAGKKRPSRYASYTVSWSVDSIDVCQ